MAIEYPDVMNDIIDARQRFESGSVQYLAYWSGEATPAGGVADMVLLLQNVMDVPSKVALRVALPESRGRLSRLPQPLFQVFQPDIQLTLGGSEVAQLTVPIQVQAHVPPGEYALTVYVQSQPEGQGTRIRPQQSENRLEGIQIHHPQGLGITQIASWGFEAQESQEQTLVLVVGEAGEPPGRVELRPRFESIWTLQEWEPVAVARREVNERRIYVVPQLTTQALYIPFMKESQLVFTDSGVQLHVGEAIFLAKILTYTVTHLMQDPQWQDCLLVPIYAYAQVNEQSTDEPLWLVTQYGYTHIVDLAIAISFSLVEELLRRQAWAPSEQRLVREYVIDCLHAGANVAPEFVYLPLILGGIAVADQVVFEGETVQESLRFLAKAKAARAELFADPDLADLNDTFDRLVARRARG
jgi:hypothetical protein